MQASAGRSAIAHPGAQRALRDPALFILAMILMFSFSMFPRGYMPARTVSGGFTITLCSGFGLKSKTVDAPARPSRGHIGSEKCDMVGAAAILAPAIAMPMPEAAPVALSLWSVRAFALRFRAAFDPNAPPTAPPLLAL